MTWLRTAAFSLCTPEVACAYRIYEDVRAVNLFYPILQQQRRGRASGFQRVERHGFARVARKRAGKTKLCGGNVTTVFIYGSQTNPPPLFSEEEGKKETKLNENTICNYSFA